MGGYGVVRVIDSYERELCTIFLCERGTPDGWMLEVAEFLAGRRFLMFELPSPGEEFRAIEGMDDLAAQVITFLKLRASGGNGIKSGAVFVVASDSYLNQSYEYHLRYDESRGIVIEVYNANYDLLWSGTPQEYVEKFRTQTQTPHPIPIEVM